MLIKGGMVSPCWEGRGLAEKLVHKSQMDVHSFCGNGFTGRFQDLFREGVP